MNKRILITGTLGFFIGLIGSFLFYDPIPEIEPKFEDEQFIKSLSEE